MKKALSKIFLLISSIALGFLTIEIGFRIHANKTDFSYVTAANSIINPNRLPKGLFSINPEFGSWGLTPNFSTVAITSDFQVEYKINKHGFRGDNIDLNKDNILIFALGDSFTFGEGVAYQNTYVGKLDKNLENANIFNLGVPGNSLSNAIDLKKYESFKPDMVILFINTAMIERNYDLLYPPQPAPISLLKTSDNQAKETIYLSRNSNHLCLPKIKLLEKLEFYQFFQYKLTLKSLLEDFNKEKRDSPEQASEITKNIFISEEEKIELEKQKIKASDEILVEHLKTLKNKIEKNGGSLLVVNIDTGPVTTKDLTTELDLNYVDLSSEIVYYKENIGPISFKIDPHYNESAHQLIYELVLPEISKLF